MSDFDGVINSLGSFGPYQRQVFILVSAFETPAAWAMLLPIFSSASPDWWCEGDIQGTKSNSNTSMFSSPSENASALPHRALKVCTLNGTQCGRIVFDDAFTSIVTEFELVCEHKYISDLITTLQMVGLLVGATLAGQIADIYGRKKVLFAMYLLLLISSLVSGFANTWQLYATLRFFVGTSIGGLLVVNFILPIEYVGVQWRTFCGCVGFWAVGLMILPLWAYFIRDWRNLCIATTCTGIPLLSLWWFIPESCRWLVTRGRYKEAEEIIVKMAARNGKPIPDLNMLRSFAKSERDLINQRRKFSYYHLFATPKSAVSALVCMYGWFASSCVYYGVSYNLKNLPGDRYINVFLSGLVEIPALIFVLCVNNRIGRRWTVFVLFLLAGLSLASIMLVETFSTDRTGAILTLAFIGKSAISGGWAAMQVFSAEKFPTLVRNLGIASCALAARIGGIVAPQIVFLNTYSAQLPFVVFGAIALACAVSSVFMSETARLPLPDQLPSSVSKEAVEGQLIEMTPVTNGCGATEPLTKQSAAVA